MLFFVPDHVGCPRESEGQIHLYRKRSGQMAEKNIIKNPEGVNASGAILTEEDLKRDRAYHTAVAMTKRLLDEGRITSEECDRICREHVRNYRPTLAPIMP
jgi:hypothetical protein